MSLRPGSKVGQHSAAAERAIMPDRPVWMVCAARVIKKNLHALSTKRSLFIKNFHGWV